MAQGAKKKTASKSESSKKTTQKAASQPDAAPSIGAKYHREILGTVFVLLAFLSLLGCFNVDAWLINFICGLVKGLVGSGFYIFPLSLLAAGWILIFHKQKPVKLRVVAVMLMPLILGALLQLLISKVDPDPEIGVIKFVGEMYTSGKLMTSGGVVAGLLGIGLRGAVSTIGAVPILIFLLILLIVIAYHTTVGRMVASVRNKRAEKAALAAQADIVVEKKAKHNVMPEITELDTSLIPKTTVTGTHEPAPQRKKSIRAFDIAMDDEEAVEILDNQAPGADELEAEEKKGFFTRRKKAEEPVQEAAPAEVEPLSMEEAAKIAGVPVIETFDVTTESIRSEKKRTAAEVKEESENITKLIEEKSAEDLGEYRYPPIGLLKSNPAINRVDGREEAELNRDRLSTTLHSFGVSANVTEITRGPTVTRYDIELDAGVKLSKITNLAGDLALALGVTGVRIAPIPDKIATVGIEVPNKIVSTVYLRDIIDSGNFRTAQSKLSFGIGKDIGGNCIVGNIAKMPHLLIAGTTGSGKSVCMNSLIISLLYKSSPEEVRFIMIDPKMVELGIYNGIPHLYVPVVTDPKKAAGALQWVVVEMLKRYRLFSEVGVRDLATYNSYQEKNGGQTLPQVVTVIDELADLMMVASKEVEESICRVAQMGRAAGMHLVIATQRPSADVITGLMKANIPSRIAFAVSSSLESRIILDAPGAEKLIGMGDMLYAPLGVGKPVRVQGAFVSDDERENIINFIKEGTEANYSQDIMDQIEKAAADKDKGGKSDAPKASDEPQSDFDELLPQAVEVIFETKQASVSMLQRRLKLGYSRAARIVDQMEEIGVVGPFEGSKPRQIMITQEQWQEMQMRGSAPMDAYQESLPLDEEMGEEE